MIFLTPSSYQNHWSGAQQKMLSLPCEGGKRDGSEPTLTDAVHLTGSPLAIASLRRCIAAIVNWAEPKGHEQQSQQFPKTPSPYGHRPAQVEGQQPITFLELRLEHQLRALGPPPALVGYQGAAGHLIYLNTVNNRCTRYSVND